MALNANVGTAWISVVADTGKLSNSISGAIQKAEKGMSGEGLGKKLASGLGKTLKVGVASAGVAAGGILAASLTKGLGRLSGIENAQAKLAGLGHEAKGVESIMENALASVKGTAYGLEDAATVAASAVAAGIKPGKDLERTLKLTGDAANIAGVDMATMGSIINKVATADMAQMDVMNQMMDAGIPILQMVADEMGVTTEEARKMASGGKVSFETFQSALEEGVGGAALKAGETVQGSFANMGAAAGRFGAKLADPAFTAAPAIFTALGGVFDEVNDAITPATDRIGEVLTPALENLATIIEERVAPWMADLAGKAGDLAASGLEKALDPSTWEYVGEIFGKVRDTVSELWPSIESLAGSFLTISQSVSVATWEALTSVLDALAPVIESVLVPLLEKVAAFAAENPETIEKLVWAFLAFKGVGAIAGPVGTATKTLGNLGGAVSGVSKAFKGATFGQGLLTLMGGAKSANPILAALGKTIGTIFSAFWKLMPVLSTVGKVFMTVIRFVNPWVAGITLVVGALTWFFTQTETGKAIMETALSAIRNAWNWVVEAVSSGWENYIKPALEALWVVAQNVLGVIATAILAPLLIAWNLLSAGIKAAWENIIRPAWEAVSSFAASLYNDHLAPVFGWISEKWTWLSAKIQEGVFLITQEYWPLIQFKIQELWATYISPIIGWISDKWAWLSFKIQEGVWNIRNYWDLMIFKLQELWALHVQPILDSIAEKWNWLKDKFGEGWNWIKENVFDKMGAGLDTLKGWFQAGVDGIAKIWDGLRAAAAGPVRFVVDTVWNNGILAAWNSIAEFLPGIDAKDKIPLGDLGGYATGGVLPGYTPGRDVHEFYSPTGGRIHLSGGEAIMRPEWTRAVGGPGAIERMNRDAKTGKLRNSSGHGPSGMWDLGGFASGGVIGAMMDIVRAKYGNVLSMTSGQRPGGGMHGAGLATDWSNGSGNTPAQLSLAHDIAQTYPGSAELIYDSPGWSGNIKNGQNVGPFGQFYTMAQAGRHDHHVHWGMTTPPTMQFGGGVFEGGSNGGGVGGAIVNWIADKARSIWSSVVDPIKDKIGGKAGDWGGSSFAEIPGSMFTSLVDAAWSRLSSLFGSGGGSDSGSVDTSNVPGDVVGAVETVFARHGFTGAEWEAAKWIIQQESSWSPTAQNPSSGAYGLFQFNPMGGNTLGAYLPDRNTDPAVQADAGARYMKDRYGTPSAAKRFWEQNHWYANGGVVPGLGVFDTGGILNPGNMAVNLSGKPERVLPPELTVAFDKFIQSMPELAQHIETASVTFARAASELEEPLRVSAEDYAMGQARSALGMVGLGDVVDIATGVTQKVQGIMSDEEVRKGVEEVKRVALDPDGRYSGAEIEKKLRELGIEIDHIKSDLGGSLVGGLIGMA